MGRPRLTSSWLAALVSWAVATVLVVGAYAAYLAYEGRPFRWEIARDAALIAAVMALINAFRDRNRKG